MFLIHPGNFLILEYPFSPHFLHAEPPLNKQGSLLEQLLLTVTFIRLQLKALYPNFGTFEREHHHIVILRHEGPLPTTARHPITRLGHLTLQRSLPRFITVMFFQLHLSVINGPPQPPILHGIEVVEGGAGLGFGEAA